MKLFLSVITSFFVFTSMGQASIGRDIVNSVRTAKTPLAETFVEIEKLVLGQGFEKGMILVRVLKDPGLNNEENLWREVTVTYAKSTNVSEDSGQPTAKNENYWIKIICSAPKALSKTECGQISELRQNYEVSVIQND